MARPRNARWRADGEFVATARRRWPSDVSAALSERHPDYANAVHRLTRRHEGFVAAREEQASS